MLYEPRIKVESAFLGSRLGDAVYQFARDAEGKVIIPPDHWEWAVNEACLSLKLDHVEPACFLPVAPLFIPTTVLYNRTHTRRGERVTTMHESVRKGAELSFEIVVSGSVPPRASIVSKEPPEFDEILQILKFIGAFLGLSPYGSEKGFGRFSLLSLTPKIPKL